MVGKSLAHYQITARIGKGGMGEVYRAKDTRLGRDVAIKVLPEEFAGDSDRLVRFQREAKLLASLNHPNIAAIHGLEEAGGAHFLVLELIEGQTLADRMKSGPVPVEEALKLGLQIAEALEAAHDKGVIHRDLKPANIKVTPDGNVKVLDFGLAKAYAGGPEDINLSNSPTLSDAATRQGVILGTAAYMSPEQAKGKTVDKRADVWAFGVVLLEMLTGRQVFTGETVSDTLASVLAREPQWKSLPPNLHPRVRFLLERCLKKEPKNRYSGISDARVEIQEVLADPGGIFAQPVGTAAPHGNLRSTLPWVAAAVIVTAIIVGVVIWQLRAPEPLQVTSFYYELPEGQQFNVPIAPEVAVSPDGRQFVYCANGGLYLRSIGQLEAQLIAGTANENPRAPFFSPDGKWVAYFSDTGKPLKKIAVGGGSPIPLCDAELFLGAGFWTGDKIIFSTAATPGVMQVSENGGTPEPLFEKGDALALIAPQMLPDGKAVLYTKAISQQNFSIMVRSLESGETREITAGAIARYLPTGHLIYTQTGGTSPLGGTLFAVPFDADRLEATGDPVLLIENVSGLLGWRFAVSDSGTLAYIPGTGASPGPLGRTLVWVDREGNAEEISAPPQLYRYPKISPDGTRLALNVFDLENQTSEIFIWDEVRKTLDKLTFDKSGKLVPIWTPEGERIVYYSDHENPDIGGVYWKAADGTGNAEKLVSDPDLPLMPYSFSSDGKYLAMQEIVTQINVDISILSMENDRKRIPLPALQTEIVEGQPKISPDDRYIAYASGSSNESEIYVRPFPDVDTGMWQISQGGGTSPLWSPDGRELFYLSLDNSAVMAVDVETEPKFERRTPKVLFQNKYVGFSTDAGTPWDIHPDGRRFLMMKAPGTDAGADSSGSSRKITVIQNWFEELKERVPVE